MAKFLRTSDVAKMLGVHPNTVRLYEEWGYLPEIPRGQNRYRQYSTRHLEQARLTHLALSWPFLPIARPRLIELVKNAVSGDLGMSMELAYQHLAIVRVERTYAEAAIEFLERWAAGHMIEAPRQGVHIREAAQQLNLSVDMLRNWERNGLIEVPRDPVNRYRLYGTNEFGRLRVIRILVQSGYSQMAILQMLRQLGEGNRVNLREALHVQPDEDQLVYIAADQWLSALVDLEERAQAIIQQVSKIIELAFSS